MNKHQPKIYNEAIQHLREAQRCLELIWADDWAKNIEKTRNAIEKEWEEQDKED